MTKKLSLAPYTLKRYEPALDAYFFGNMKNGVFWYTDSVTGFVIYNLDGSLSREEILNILSAGNPNVSKENLKEHFYKVFDFLIKEEYVFESY